MDKKKSDNVNLELKKPMFIRIGLIVALALTIVAFEWRTYERVAVQRDFIVDEIEEEEIPITEREKEPPPPPPPPPPPIIEVVEDEVIVEDVEIEEIEVDEDTEVEIQEIEIVEEEVEEETIFRVVEQNPSFKGGDAALVKYMQSNIVYPAMARENNISGKVYVEFVVNPDGRVTNAKILKGVGGGCDEEALRVVNKMPKWNPGKQRGKPVKVYCTLPVNFGLK
ncbi:MAG: energy transducer TonB [Bacteroidia bacterium]|nr:energy transducer TonB [Bacteroidia bacterium]